LFAIYIAEASLVIDEKYPTKHHRNMLTETKPNNKKQQNMNET
jgi:hypothetical protein